MYIVTGASDNHFKSLCQFLRSVPADLLPRTFVWDLGLSESHQQMLAAEFPATRKRRFPYEDYPPYFNIHVAAGEYAWKPVAIQRTADEIMDESPILQWCDAGNMFTGPLTRIEATIRKQGVYTSISWGLIRRYTHPACLDYMGVKSDDPVLNMWPRNGAIVGFDLGNPAAVNFLTEWARLAQIKECIAPEGSNRDNHRQDQAVLSLLFYRYSNNQHLECSDLDIVTHRDCDA